MKGLMKRNWGRAVGEIVASIVGSVGIVFVIACIVYLNSDNLTWNQSFFGYFDGGQLSLPILSLSGIIFMAFRRHPKGNSVLWAFLLVFYLIPVIATAFILGQNPGFGDGGLTPQVLNLLWILYCALHVVWLLVLVFEPTVPSPQEVAGDQEGRVNRIKAGAAKRA